MRRSTARAAHDARSAADTPRGGADATSAARGAESGARVARVAFALAAAACTPRLGDHVASAGGSNASLDGAPACPRDAAPDRAGRCACAEGTVDVLGACVEPRVGDAFCGPGARLEGGGCAFLRCGAAERLDVATGRCTPTATLGFETDEGDACASEEVALLADARRVCVTRASTCPRGTELDDAGRCAHGPRCPPGTLAPDTDTVGNGGVAACRPVVFAAAGGSVSEPSAARGPSSDEPRVVDVGAWAQRVFGIDGGVGSRELCRPIDLLFDGTSRLSLQIHVATTIPDGDVARAWAHVDLHADEPVGPRTRATAARAVDSLIDLLRALGGTAASAVVDAHVRCELGATETGATAEAGATIETDGAVEAYDAAEAQGAAAASR